MTCFLLHLLSHMHNHIFNDHFFSSPSFVFRSFLAGAPSFFVGGTGTSGGFVTACFLNNLFDTYRLQLLLAGAEERQQGLLKALLVEMP